MKMIDESSYTLAAEKNLKSPIILAEFEDWPYIFRLINLQRKGIFEALQNSV